MRTVVEVEVTLTSTLHSVWLTFHFEDCWYDVVFWNTCAHTTEEIKCNLYFSFVIRDMRFAVL